jgi:hypothetical protein
MLLQERQGLRPEVEPGLDPKQGPLCPVRRDARQVGRPRRPTGAAPAAESDAYPSESGHVDEPVRLRGLRPAI